MTWHVLAENGLYDHSGRANYMRNELNGARAVLRREYAKRLAVYEIELMDNSEVLLVWRIAGG